MVLLVAHPDTASVGKESKMASEPSQPDEMQAVSSDGSASVDWSGEIDRYSVDRAFEILCEHAMDRRDDGVLSVPNPLRTLVLRRNIGVEFAEDLLREMIARRWVMASHERNEVIILRKERVKKLAGMSEPYQPEDRLRPSYGRLPNEFIPVRRHMEMPARAREGPIRPAKARATASKPRAERVLEYLRDAAVQTMGVFYVRGVRPLLKDRYSTDGAVVDRVLEELVERGRIERVDGWRTIRLTGETLSIPERAEEIAVPGLPVLLPLVQRPKYARPIPEHRVEAVVETVVAPTDPPVPIAPVEKPAPAPARAPKAPRPLLPLVRSSVHEWHDGGLIWIDEAGILARLRTLLGAAATPRKVDYFIGSRLSTARTIRVRNNRGRARTMYCLDDVRSALLKNLKKPSR